MRSSPLSSLQIALCAGATLAIVLLSLFHIYEQVMELVIHYVQNSLTGSMLPVINSMLSETAGLGFIGVVVQILALKGEDTWLGALSEKLYEKPEVRESLSLGVVCPHATRHASQMSQTHTHTAHTHTRQTPTPKYTRKKNARVHTHTHNPKSPDPHSRLLRRPHPPRKEH